MHFLVDKVILYVAIAWTILFLLPSSGSVRTRIHCLLCIHDVEKQAKPDRWVQSDYQLLLAFKYFLTSSILKILPIQHAGHLFMNKLLVAVWARNTRLWSTPWTWHSYAGCLFWYNILILPGLETRTTMDWFVHLEIRLAPSSRATPRFKLWIQPLSAVMKSIIPQESDDFLS